MPVVARRDSYSSPTCLAPVAGEEPHGVRVLAWSDQEIAERSDATSRVEVGAKGLEPLTSWV